jgi:mannose-6-phosphate isomerase-like protein (cupin superfamily)
MDQERLSNLNHGILEAIEVRTGEQLCENDIIRHDDIYNR